jgi:hypothetical protein
MKKLILLTILLLAACSKDDKPFIDERVANQCLRRELFNECMKILPAGPVATKYNDWDEVVAECGSQAYYMSHRKESTIPAGCR